VQESGLQSESSFAIDAFLAAQQAEGRYFDTASFTINSVKALEKLSAHQLPGSGLWLVKLIQAAVAGGAESIAIKLGRKRVKVAFRPSAIWQADELLKTVLSGVLPQDQALGHLVTAIRGSSGSVTESVTWSCGEARVELSAQSCQVTAQPHSADFLLAATRPTRARSVAQTLSSSVTQLVKQTVEEHDAVRSRCWVCPIPITLDGQKLASGYDLFKGGHVERSPWQVVRNWENVEGYVLSCCLGIRPIGNIEVGPEIPYLVNRFPVSHSDLQVEVTRPVYKGEGFLRWNSDQQICRGAVAVMVGVPASSHRVNFVLDGAVVASHALPAWQPTSREFLGITLSAKPQVGARAVIGVLPGDLDLSQFAVRDLDLPALQARLAPELTALVEKVSENLFRFYYVPFSRGKAPAVGLGVGAQMVLLTALTQGALLIPAAGMLAAITAINTASWRKKVRKALAQLDLKISKAP
jgi:hypothetical protein